MSRGYRLIHPAFGVAAFGLITFLILAVCEPENVNTERHNAEQTPRNQSDVTRTNATAGGGISSDITPQQRPDNREGWEPPAPFWWDTLAQWVMAIGTIATIALVLWTLCVTRGMLREARLATKAARRAAKSANATVVETRRIGEAQVRAYMCPSQVYAVKAIGEDRDDLIVEWKNMGATPATIIGYGEAKKIIRVQSIPDFGGNSISVSVHTIPKDGIYRHVIKLSEQARASGFNADERSLVWIASCIVYQDIFRRTFIHYCKGYIEPPEWRWDPIGATQNRMYHFAEVDGRRVENTIKLHGKYGDWIVSENPDYGPQDMEFIRIDFGLKNAKPISGDPN